MPKRELVANIELPGRPWTMNEAIRGDWRGAARRTKEIREQAGWLWRQDLGPSKKGQYLPGLLTVKIYVRTQDNRVQDIGACMPAVKAAIDGLVDSGWIPDDGPQWIHKMVFVAPSRQRMVTNMLIQIWATADG